MSFLIVMLLMMSIVTYKSEYIIGANEVYIRLNDFKEMFYLEARIIDTVKCLLVQGEELEDFYVDGYLVSVYRSGDNYSLYFDKYCIEIEVYEKQIIDFVVYSI